MERLERADLGELWGVGPENVFLGNGSDEVLSDLLGLLRDRYDTVGNLSDFEGRVAVLVAEEDEVIPPRFGLALAERLGLGARLWTFPGAGHNSWPSGAGALWWDEVVAYTLSGAP